MSFLSLLRRLNWRFPGQDRAKKLPYRSRSRSRALPSLEALESRDLMAAPTIVSVSPADGSTLSSPPTTITVTFSETMTLAPLQTAANYKLFDSLGNAIAFSNAQASNGPNGPNSIVTLTLSNPNLPVGTFTLFVRADQLTEAADAAATPMAAPGQLVAANLGTGNLSTFAMPGNGQLGALSNYPAPALGTTQASPKAVALADLDGTGTNALIVANAGTDQIAIFKGLSGGGYSTLPTTLLNLPTGSLPSGIVARDLSGDGLADIAVADSGTGQVTVFTNRTTTAGNFAFQPVQNYAAGTDPLGLVATDFNSDGSLDLAVANGVGTVDANNNTQYTVTVLQNRGGSFNTLSSFIVGTTLANAGASSGLISPTGLAAGLFNGDTKPDLAVSGATGVATLFNTTQPFATPTFAASVLLAGPATTSVATGVFRASPSNNQADILATTAANGGQLVPYVNASAASLIAVTDGAGTFTAGAAIAAGVTNPTALTLRDVDNSGAQETIFLGNNPNGTLNVLPKLQSGAITNAINAPVTQTITITSPGHGLVNGQVVVLTGVGGDTNANGTFYVTNRTTDTFDLANSNGNAAYTLGGSWVAIPRVITNTTGNGVGPIVVTSPNHNLVTGQQVTISGVNGNTAANGTWFVTRIDATTFSLNGTVGNGTFAAAGSPFAPAKWALLPYQVDANPVSLDFGDTNGDGLLDVVTANSAGPDVSLLLGLGTPGSPTGTPNGAFAQGTTLTTGNNSQPRGVAVGDLNGDGIADLVAADSQTNQVTVFLGLASGGYATGASYFTTTVTGGATVGRQPVKVALANLDGKLDIVTIDAADSMVSVLLNNGNGTFGAAKTFAVGNAPTGLAVADLNNDGKQDVVVTHNGSAVAASSRGLTVLLGNGDGTFQPATEVAAAAGMHLSALVAADFNADGNTDVVVADSTASKVIEFIGDGSGALTAAGQTYTVGPNPVALAAADFNRDGFLDVVSVSGSSNTTRNISVLLSSAGTGFASAANTTLPNGFPIASVIAANVNQDAFPDLVIGTQGGPINSVSSFGTIFITSPNHGLKSGDVVTVSGVQGNTAANGYWTITKVDNNTFFLNGSFGNGFYTGGGVWFSDSQVAGAGAYNNVYTLTGLGNGRFNAPTPSSVGGTGSPVAPPTNLAVVSDPFQRVTTFNSGGQSITVNLIANGSFEITDLSGEQGNLDGWTAYNKPDTPGSAGAWAPQTGASSPLSLATVPGPTDGQFQAMLDEQDQIPQIDPTRPNPNAQDSYEGSHALYQDVTIPSTATGLTLSFTLYIDNTGSSLTNIRGATGDYSDTTGSNGTLDWNSGSANQQVRVDLMSPAADVLDVGSGVLRNVFQTAPGQPSVQTLDFTGANKITLTPAEVQAFAGKTIRFRVAAANNRGKLIVGVDNVQLVATFSDTAAPALTNLQLRNPTFLADPIQTAQTTDPTIIGRVKDNGSVNNIRFVDFDMQGNGFGGPDDVKVTTFDANGNFSFSATGLSAGVHTIPVEVVDNASNPSRQNFTFIVQGQSLVNWQATGPGPIDISSAGLDYTSVTGNVTSIVADPNDPSGNTIYLGSDNGGVWRTTDGGNDWLALTDSVTDPQTGQRVSESIGDLAVGHVVRNGLVLPIVYAGTGVANTTSTVGGGGILKSDPDVNAGKFTVVGQSTFQGAHISKVVVDPTDANTVFVAVAWFDAPSPAKQPGVYYTSDGGLTWTNVMTPGDMYATVNDTPSGPTEAQRGITQLASVTDLIIDPISPTRLIAGLGNIGKTGAGSDATTGVWKLTPNSGTPRQFSWVLEKGGDNPRVLNATLPNGDSGALLGRVTLAQGSGRAGDEPTIYVLITTQPLPPGTVRGTFFGGQSAGLYKTKDNLLNFTKVMLREGFGRDPNGVPIFTDIGLSGNNAANSGALVVDPTNPNVVYVGGSTAFNTTGIVQHSPIRVDTGDMRDTTYFDFNSRTYANDGDDIQKVLQAEQNYAAQNKGAFGYAYSPLLKTDTTGPAYSGEGVYWYDLATAGVNTFGNRTFLPTTINSLAFDPQGRLLFGTVNGIWRGVPYGFGYDFTSGEQNVGVLPTSSRGGFGQPPIKQPNPPGMSFTALNGNLQITDLTSVAIDPTSSNTYYTTQLYSGSAILTGGGPQSWTTLGLTGPGFLGVPNGAEIRAVPPAANALPGTQTTLYRDWQFLNPNALELEVSSNAGTLFNQTISSGIHSQDNAAVSPPFAVNPTPVNVNGVSFNQLLFGTDKVYLTKTSLNVFDLISGVLSPTGNVSALAFAPSASGTYYAGTTDGKMFVQLPTLPPNVSFQNRSFGLPAGGHVNGITVDPNNANVAYAMLTTPGGGGTYKTSDAGLNWALVLGLPNQAAYALVVDPRSEPGAPQGLLYVGTQVGVFQSIDGGRTWTDLSLNGLPAAPVVDLQLNPALSELVAAVQGRGVFELSTRRSGPAVVSSTPTTPQSAPLTTVTVKFDEPVDPLTFTLAANVAARNGVALGLTTSPEGLTHRVQDIYSTYLRRQPGPNDPVSGWVSLLSQSTAQAQAQGYANADSEVVAQIISTNEYFNNQGGGTNTAWLNKVYNDLFGRTSAGDPAATMYLNQLNANAVTRLQVATALTGTNTTPNDEYERNLVAGLENKYLGTNYLTPAPANDVALNALVQSLDAGTSVPGIAASLLASTQYYTTAGGLTGLAVGDTTAQASLSAASALAYGNFSGAKDAQGQPIPDLVVVDSGTNTLRIYQGQSGGGYSDLPAAILNLPANAGATAVVVADFNNDKLPDVAVANTGLAGANSVSVFLNTTAAGGPITFAAGVGYNGGNKPTGIVAGDVDSDGNVDLVVSDSLYDASNNYDVSVLRGTGAPGTFLAATSIKVGARVPAANDLTAPTGLVLADFNGDNKPDLAVSGTNGLEVLRNTSTAGAPSFVALGAGLLTTLATTSVTAGVLDTAVLASNPTTHLQSIVATTDAAGGELLLFQNLDTAGAPEPSFAQVKTVAVGAAPRAVNAVDLNGDGVADLAVVNDVVGGTLTVVRNTTTHATVAPDTLSFATPVTYSTYGDNPVALAFADTNQDRILDAAVANLTSDTFAVLPGLTPGTIRTATDTAFLQGAYVNVLHRAPDPGAYNVWLPQLPAQDLAFLTGPTGNVSPLAITDLDPVNHETYQLTFAPQVLDGTYTLGLGVSTLINPVTLQPYAVKDFTDVNGKFANTGNAMNQNGNQANGEFPADRFFMQVAVNNSDDGKFVSGLYHDLLGFDPSGRAADTTGFLAFLGLVDPARFTVLNQFATGYAGSPENQNNIVSGLFTTYLRRAPSTGELSSYQGYLASGALTEQQIVGILVGSDEYFNNPTLGNSNNATWVNQAFKDVLGRPVDPGTQTTFVGYLTSGQLTRTQLANIIVFSPEGLSRVVYSTWLRFLDRAPSAGEVATWVGALGQRSGAPGRLSPFEALEAALVGSQEFFYLAGNTNKAWATAVYAKLLQRPVVDPNGTEVSGLVQAVLNQGPYAAARQQVIGAILGSSEYRGRLIAQDYVTYLGRQPSAAEVAVWQPVLAAGGRDDSLIAGILSSNEFSNLQGGASSNDTWLNKAYADLLHRAPDAGAQGFRNILNNNDGSPGPTQVARQQVALLILSSLEQRRNQVAGLFNRYLARTKAIRQDGSDAEVNGYANLMTQGFTQEQIVSFLVSSPEYYLLSHTFP